MNKYKEIQDNLLTAFLEVPEDNDDLLRKIDDALDLVRMELKNEA